MPTLNVLTYKFLSALSGWWINIFKFVLEDKMFLICQVSCLGCKWARINENKTCTHISTSSFPVCMSVNHCEITRLNSSNTHTHPVTTLLVPGPEFVWKNMIGEIPTLWASSPHIFFLHINVGSLSLWAADGLRVCERGEACTTSSQDPSLSVLAHCCRKEIARGPAWSQCENIRPWQHTVLTN